MFGFVGGSRQQLRLYGPHFPDIIALFSVAVGGLVLWAYKVISKTHWQSCVR